MKIIKLEYENFRNFRDHGSVKFSTDGKVTLIYGKNGDGKTTMHQLFQWILYGDVKFNKTATDKLYNKEFERECEIGKVFEVKGIIDFEHDGISYSVTRTHTYKKSSAKDIIRMNEEFTLLYQDENYSWRRISNPKERIERVLPSGLSNYFFFDGEGMIADLSVKGRVSANRLKTSLYAMFGLDVLASALKHIGNTELKTTVLGSLFLNNDGLKTNSTEIAKYTSYIEQFQRKIKDITDQKVSLEANIDQQEEFIRNTSEQIGENRTKDETEKLRNQYLSSRDLALESAKQERERFGLAVFDIFPKLLISKAVKEARKKINLKVENDKLPPGVNRDFLEHLISAENSECICGQQLGEKEKKHLQYFLNLLPPKSFASLYQSFIQKADDWGKDYDLERINNCIRSYSLYCDKASDWDNKVREIDEANDENAEIQNLYRERRLAEEELIRLREELDKLNENLGKLKQSLHSAMNHLSKLRQGNKEAQKNEKKIKIMQKVYEYFQERLNAESMEYSIKLQENIQYLLDSMLVSKRKVTVSPQFAVCVMDSNQDESKSEGQFAVVSFAYIGGILKMLKDEKKLLVREYPLVLDGPFSKLDVEHRQKVVNELIDFAPQVILFSKDDLHGVFNEDKIGHVWRFSSNEEKNVSCIEEGYLEGYFNGNNN